MVELNPVERDDEFDAAVERLPDTRMTFSFAPVDLNPIKVGDTVEAGGRAIPVGGFGRGIDSEGLFVISRFDNWYHAHDVVDALSSD